MSIESLSGLASNADLSSKVSVRVAVIAQQAAQQEGADVVSLIKAAADVGRSASNAGGRNQSRSSSSLIDVTG